MSYKSAVLAMSLVITSSEACSDYIEPPMVTIPQGEFVMGSKDKKNEQPIHHVTVPSFRLGKYEVTVKEFSKFIADTNYAYPKECFHQPTANWIGEITKGSWKKNALTSNSYQPVVCINVITAIAYADWLSAKTGKHYRLPSEAEWEYVAKSGQFSKYRYGEKPDNPQVCEYANLADRSAEQQAQQDFGASYMGTIGVIPCDDLSGYASIVGMYQANNFGVFDLIGNVQEYVRDCANKNYNDAPNNATAWLSGDCSKNGLRGGSWHWYEFSASQRSTIAKDFAGVLEGFRLAQEININQDQSLSQATLLFERDLQQAQQKEKQRRISLKPYPQKPIALTLTKDQASGAIRLSWRSNINPNTQSYDIYQTQAFGGQYRKIASNIKTNYYTVLKPVPRKHSYVVTAVNSDRFSEYSEPVITEDTVVVIPGTIQAEDYNQMFGMLVDKTEDKDGGLLLTGWGVIRKGNWAQYQVKIKEDGLYHLTYRISSSSENEGFDLSIDDKPLAQFLVPDTGGLNIWQSINGQAIFLQKGSHSLKVTALADNWRFNWFALNQ